MPIGKKVLTGGAHLRKDYKREEELDDDGFVQLQEEKEAFREDETNSYGCISSSIDDDSYLTTVSRLELSSPNNSSCYQTAASFLETSENVDPKKFSKQANNKAGAEKCIYSQLNDANVANMDRAEVDRLIAYILYLLTKQRHHPTDVNSNCIERESFTFKKFLQMFRTARSASPEKEKKTGIFDGFFGRSETRTSFSTKKNTLPLSLLLNVFSYSVEADGDNYEAVNKLVHSDPATDSVNKPIINSFFNSFIIAYYALKNSAAEPAFLDLLHCIAKCKPEEQRIRKAIEVLTNDQSINVGLQTDLDNRKYQQRGRGLNRDRCTVIEMKRNARRAKMAASGGAEDDSIHSEGGSSSFRCDDLQDAPLPKAIVKPRSVSRHRRLCANPQLSTLSSSTYGESSQNTSNLSTVENDELSCNVTSDSGLSSSTPPPPVPCMTSTPLKAPPPPPPLPPPPSFLLSPCMRSPLFSPLSVVKSENTYKKKRATNTIHWEAIKPEITLNNLTVFSGPDSSEANFSEEQREKLEIVFERMKRSGLDFKGRAGNKSSSSVVQLLNEKRALSLGIVLAKFRPITVTQLVAMIESQSANDLDIDTLDTLLKHFPLEDELNMLKKHNSPEQLKDAELFCYLASRNPLLKLRIELKVIVGFLKTDLTRQTNCIDCLKTACNSVHNNPSINVFLRRCLQFGNFLNQSTFAAHASGFSLNSLLNILRAKGTTSNTRLVDILAETAEPLLQKVVDCSECLKTTRGNTVEDLEKSVGLSQRKVSNAINELQVCSDEKLRVSYAPLLLDSLKKYDRLISSLVEIRKKEKELQTYYCTPNMPLETLLTTLHDAICLFQEAITMAKEKELRRCRQSRNRFVSSGKELPNTPSKRSRNHLESPNVKDLVYLLDTTDV